MRIGIYGGSFNPIHNGHLGMAREILKLGIVDRILFVVSPQNPFKRCQGDKLNSLWDDQLRLHLTSIAVEDIPGIEASDIEFQMPRPSYMVDTLARLQEQNPDDTIVLIIGMDNWECFDRWYKAEEIKDRYEIVVLPREVNTSPLPSNWRMMRNGLNVHYHHRAEEHCSESGMGDTGGGKKNSPKGEVSRREPLLYHKPQGKIIPPPWEGTGEVTLINMSSTWIRQQIAENPDYNGEGLPPRVWKEIQQSNLSIIN